MRSSLTLLSTVALLTAALSLTGCGLKDDLYLPSDQSAESSDDDGEDDEADS